MAFDPDSYLAKKSSFDPDAYLASKKPKEQTEAPGKLESLLRGAAQSATFDFADEAAAAAESVFTDKTYQQALAESRANFHAAQEANPGTYLGGQLAGGLATSLIPGLGLGKVAQAGNLGARALAAGKLGAGMGAVSALGASEDKGIGDVLTGAGVGALAGAGGEVLMSGIGSAARYVGRRLKDAVNPDTQLGLAVGARASDLDPSKPLGQKLQKALHVFDSEDGFIAPDGRTLTQQDLYERVVAKMEEKGAEIGKRVQSYGDTTIEPGSMRQFVYDIGDRFSEIVQSAPPAERESIAGQLSKTLDELVSTGGNLSKIWQLKSNSGGWAGKAWTMAGQPPPVKEGYQQLNTMLNDFLTGETDALFRRTGDTALKDLNRSYSAAATLEPVLGRALGREAAATSSLGLGARDLGAGGALAGIAGGLGLPGAAATPLAFGGAMLNQYSNSTAGRVTKARIGQAMEQAVQNKSVMEGAIPRTVKGAQDWLKRNYQSLPPQIQQGVGAILGAPEDRAEQMIKAMMPSFAQYFAKSKYPSELNGKVSAHEDKAAIEREMRRLQLPSSQMAMKISALNRDGTIPAEVYSPTDYADEMAQFAAGMMGDAL
jgi:hypothetical protein